MTAFEGATRRMLLFAGLRRFVAAFSDLAIPCEMLVDGSFLTRKQAPSDIDVAVRLDHDFAEFMTDEQRDLIDKVNASDRLYVPDIDGFAYISYPRDHYLFGSDLDEGETWAEQYGIEHSKLWLKGVAMISVGETDVGLRVRR